MARLRIWSVVLIILHHFCQRGVPCGISTHVEIAHRALEFFTTHKGNVNYRQLLLNHQDAFQAGSIYPDAFYSVICKIGLFHDVSEDTHWSPFLTASIHYIRRNYPQPWDEATEKLVAFLFGIASHIVADVSWHSLGINQGFLKAMGEIDFQGSYPKAHRAGDFGGDVVSQFELDFSYLASNWYVPIKDLAAIYKEFYGKEVITESTITDCTYLQFLELHGERLAVAKLFPTYAGKSPFLVEKFHEYFLGGVDDMAFWTNNIFELTSRMLENGTSGCFLPENPLFINCTRQHEDSHANNQSKGEHHKNTTSLLTKTLERNINYTERGVRFNIQPWATNSLGFATNVWRPLAAPHQKSSKYISKPTASYFLTSPYARLGWAMISADLNQDGYEDLVAGAPGYSTLGSFQTGRVYVVYGNQSGLPPEDMDLDGRADQVLQGHQPSGRFGSALAVLDFNEDGLPDLAVGAPSVGSQFLTYKGAVYVYFGTEGRGLASEPNVTITCQYSYCNLGWSLLAADVDGDENADLVVGSPYAPGGGQQRGFVVAFYSYFNRSDQGLLSVQDANWMVTGEENYAWFGFSLASCQLENGTLLLVGSPTWKSCAGCGPLSAGVRQSVGKVYGYHPPSTKHWFAVAGDKAMGRMGSSLASGVMSVAGITRTVLVVGSPTADSLSRISLLSSVLHQAGLALVYDLTDSANPLLLSTFSGDRATSRFGGDVYLSDLDNDGLDEMIVTSPLRTNKISVLFGGAAGRVYIYHGRQTSSGNVTAHCRSWVSPCPEDWAQYVLISPEDLSRFGSSVTTVKSERKKDIVVAAERSSAKARLSGRIFVYSL
ncbi:Phosphatidylinositol-glycan-specific phospholipase D [Buceros rhinoceros silvestris]|uniref:Phosphatidylinositol-glycan-specific phospholipase D n=1 Tax=Buceros rhinoceros silvestris TaxID=175836 RepID=A0A091H7V6_BUCRH|nr:PREDICTED: phosphatidylinositol-glycan-specific phospholipase D [Buceros rhinoceros silvestris]KFO90912.1 Phosphatidylinositol-glycan-specific phospholipase D [Buceros rhinoceros silvestris]